MSDQLDRHPELLTKVEADLHTKPLLELGAHGMSIESILRSGIQELGPVDIWRKSYVHQPFFECPLSRPFSM
jgi:hypothetical protein